MLREWGHILGMESNAHFEKQGSIPERAYDLQPAEYIGSF